MNDMSFSQEIFDAIGLIFAIGSIVIILGATIIFGLIYMKMEKPKQELKKKKLQLEIEELEYKKQHRDLKKQFMEKEIELMEKRAKK